MKIGLQVMRFDWSENASEIRDRLITIAKLADQSGFYSLWVMDHLFQMGGEFGPPRGTHARRVQYDQLPGRHHKPDPFGNAAYREFLSVSRSPDQNGLNADVLSGGRPYLGIGAGWYKREARGRGLPLPEVSERFARLEETLQIAKHMWSGQRTPDLGKHYQL